MSLFLFVPEPNFWDSTLVFFFQAGSFVRLVCLCIYLNVIFIELKCLVSLIANLGKSTFVFFNCLLLAKYVFG